MHLVHKIKFILKSLPTQPANLPQNNFSIIILAALEPMSSNHPLLSPDPLLLNRPILRTRITLLLQPLLRHIGISPESPVVVVAADEGEEVVGDEEEDHTHKRFVSEIGSTNTEKLYPVKHPVKLLAEGVGGAQSRWSLTLRAPIMNRSPHLRLRWHLRLTLEVLGTLIRLFAF